VYINDPVETHANVRDPFEYGGTQSIGCSMMTKVGDAPARVPKRSSARAVTRRFSVLSERNQVSSYIAFAMQAADAERNSLGFLPERVYHDAALSGKLLIAVAQSSAGDDYAGHILFGGTFPFLRVFQVLVTPEYRRRKIASLLVQTLVRYAEERGYLSIKARVAEDLEAANVFWEREGFAVLSRKSGGSSRQRTINVRARALDAPTLFGFASEVTDPHSLAIDAPVTLVRPLYVMDVNVFLDLVKNRDRSAATQRLIAAAWNRSVELTVSEEFVAELRRASPKEGGSDPVLDVASALPRLPRVPTETLNSVLQKLGPLVFPTKAAENRLSLHDHSDLLHIATAIHHGAAGFVTGEKALLKRTAELKRQFGIDVVGSAEFVEFIEPAERESEHDLRSVQCGDELDISDMQETTRHESAAFLESLGVSAEFATAALSPGGSGALRRRLQVRIAPGGDFVAFASWDASTRVKDQVAVFVVVDDDHSDAASIASHLLEVIAQDVASYGPKLLVLTTPEGCARVRVAAVERGFFPASASQGHASLHKIAVGGAVTVEAWPAIARKIESLAGIRFPTEPPAFAGTDTRIDLGDRLGRQACMSLARLEKLLHPAIFVLPDRPGLILPIRRTFAEHLFAGAPQLPLLPRESAVLSSDRLYFSSPRSSRLLPPGTPIVFYESASGNGRKAAFACATVKSNRVIWADTISERLLQKGVLSRTMIQKRSMDGLISLLHFENSLLFQHPIPFSRLREIGAVDGANLVTVQRLRPTVLAAILSEGGALAL
jgi:GNAT superfamily N-acetyltransferase/predicted nucleic acid-binding protein